MWFRSDEDGRRDEWLPYRISPLVGETSVASMARSVDFPAPFGPSNPTMSPARALNETCDTARRRPKCRETSSAVTDSKSDEVSWVVSAGRAGRRS